MDESLDRQLPLLALLGRAHDALEAEFDRRLAASRFSDLSLAHSRNVLRHLGREGCCRVSQLSERSGVSKQALSLQIAHLEKCGYLLAAPDPDDGRARVLALTDQGRSAQRVVGRILGEMDAEWSERWGDQAWDVLRGQLAALIRTGEGRPTP